MLKALLHRKLRGAPQDRGEGVETEAWDEAPGLEDVLTSTVFERFAYLDPDLAWDLLRATCEPLHGDPLPGARPAGLPAWSFWPRLAPCEHGAKARYVEPDALVAWGAHGILIEAKHRGDQDAAQWIEQVRAVRAAPAHAGRTLWVVAAGGLTAADSAAQRDAFVSGLGERAPGLLHLRWERLCEEIHERLRGPLPAGTAAVLRDLCAALALWGYRKRLGFDSLPRYAHRSPIRTGGAELNALKEWSIR
jgi:hypothetical protein